jgi:hypothetical protein
MPRHGVLSRWESKAYQGHSRPEPTPTRTWRGGAAPEGERGVEVAGAQLVGGVEQPVQHRDGGHQDRYRDDHWRGGGEPGAAAAQPIAGR